MRLTLLMLTLLLAGCHAMYGESYRMQANAPGLADVYIQLEQPRRSVTGQFRTYINVALEGTQEERYVTVRAWDRCGAVLPAVAEYGTTYRTSSGQFVAIEIPGRIEDVAGGRYIVTVHESADPSSHVVFCAPVP